MFDRNGFMNWLEETFITNSFGRNIVSEIIEYAYEHQNVSLDQFAYFVSDLLPEVEFLEVEVKNRFAPYLLKQPGNVLT